MEFNDDDDDNQEPLTFFFLGQKFFLLYMEKKHLKWKQKMKIIQMKVNFIATCADNDLYYTTASHFWQTWHNEHVMFVNKKQKKKWIWHLNIKIMDSFYLLLQIIINKIQAKILELNGCQTLFFFVVVVARCKEKKAFRLKKSTQI